MTMKKGTIQVYYGLGFGKTSAALGNAVRGASHGDTVYFIQFLKGQIQSEFMTRMEPEIKTFRFESSVNGFDTLNEEEKKEEKANILNGLNYAKKALCTGECDILILDEILGVIGEGVVTSEDLLDVLSSKGPATTVILTGRDLPDDIRKVSDEVYNLVPEK